VSYARDKELFDNPGLQIYETDTTASFGRTYTVQLHKITFLDSDGKVAGLLGIVFDMTDKKQLERTLFDMARIDILTGLSNRRSGIEQIERVFKESVRKDRVFSILMIDIDYFKEINDTYGHSVGDLVLQLIANRSARLMRDCDIFFRYGGEEFIACLPETQIDETHDIAERLRAQFDTEGIEIPKGDIIRVTMSIGIAAYPEHGSEIEHLINESDKALYAAKNSGRNCIMTAQHCTQG